MKFSTPVVLALVTAPVVTASTLVDVCYIDETGAELEHTLVSTTTMSPNMATWYGYGDVNGIKFSANTPSNIEASNDETVGFVPVYFKNVEKVGLAMILDKPDGNAEDLPDGNPPDGNIATKIECTGDCGTFPELTFIDVQDDPFNNNNNDKYKSLDGAIYTGHKWYACCTDGWATEPIGCAEVCVTILSATQMADVNQALEDANRPKFDGGRSKNPAGLNKVGVYNKGTDDEDVGEFKLLNPNPPEGGEKYCFKTCGGMGGGDPHFKTFGGKWYDFMGACDLVLVDAPNFTRDAGLRVDIRTAIRYTYSYIESAVLALGEDTFEVSSFGQYAVNGVSNADLPATLNGFTITHTQPSEKIHIFKVEISKSEHIIIKTLKDMVSVNWGMLLNHRMNGARGMLGDAGNGKMLGRNGTVAFEDPIEFAAEWQVREDEAMNFMTSRAPQHPAQCVMPDTNAAEKKRRLGESIALEAAEKACSNWDPEMRAACVHDVIATGDLELAEAGAF